MENLTNKEPCIKDTAAQDSTDKKPGIGTTRSVSVRGVRTIPNFLRRSTPYEADSIRVTVGHAVGKGDEEMIETENLLAVNRFLNTNLPTQTGQTTRP